MFGKGKGKPISLELTIPDLFYLFIYFFAMSLFLQNKQAIYSYTTLDMPDLVKMKRPSLSKIPWSWQLTVLRSNSGESPEAGHPTQTARAGLFSASETQYIHG